MTISLNPYETAQTAGTGVSLSGQGRVLTLLESLITHPSHTDSLANKGDAVVCGSIVGVCENSAAAATDYLNIDTEGIWNLSVVGSNAEGNSAVAVGDRIFINTTTAVLSKISTVATNLFFGYALGAVSGGATTVIAVKVHSQLTNAGITFADGLVMGTSSVPIVNDTIGNKVWSIYTDNGATSGDSRGIYWKHNFTGAGGGGDASRFYGDVVDVRGATARGCMSTIGFGTSGSVSGLATGLSAVCMIPDTALPAGGEYFGAQSSLYYNSATSSTANVTQAACHLFSIDGNSTGQATATAIMAIQAPVAILGSGASGTTIAATFPILINGVLRHVMCSSAKSS